MHSGDSAFIQFSRLFESLRAPFLISDGVSIPAGGYGFSNLIASYTPGAQHHISGSSSVEIGTFYDGNKKTAAFKGRVDMTSRIFLEPNVSFNWIDLPEGNFTASVIGGRFVYTLTPEMFTTALIQYGSSTHSVSANLRFRWEYRPGSELFLVYTEGRSTLPAHGTELQSRGFVVKMNRLFRF
jgi:hypothetical protein